MTGALLTLLLVAQAAEGERARLQNELHHMARRATWTGADRTYRQLVALEEPLNAEDHLVGFQAARQLGDTLRALQRLQRVTPLSGDVATDASGILENLRATHGLVAIVAPPGRAPALEAVELPFAPDQRLAIEAARATLAEAGTVRALLPAGSYRVDGQPFEVRAGTAWQVHVIE